MLSYQLQQNSDSNFTKLESRLLTPFQRKSLEKSLKDDLPEQYRQRIKIMLFADEGKTQTEICQVLGCSQATARHWLLVARAGQAHNWKEQPIGRPKTVNDQYLERLKELVSQSPREFGYSFRRWTANWLSKHLAKELGIEVSTQHVNRLLKQMGLSSRPKPADTEDTTNQSGTSDRIVISNLDSANAPESPGLWLFNYII